MKTAVIVLPTLLLSGCLSTPVKPIFPEAIKDLMVACPELQTVPTGTEKLSETLTVITKNYGQYHECKAKVDGWIEWYTEQKKIYNEIK